MTLDFTNPLGLDLSLTGTGMAGAGWTQEVSPKKLRGPARLYYIECSVHRAILYQSPSVAAIEGYAHGARGNNFDIGELGGVIRLLLLKCEIPFVIISPSSLKKFATGKGNADKDTMLETAIRKYGFDGHGNNEADAFLLRTMALMHDDPGLTKPQREAVEKVDWSGAALR